MQHVFQDILHQAPSARSPRLTLRPLRDVDATPLWEATRHPAFNKFLTWPAPASRDEVVERVASLQEAMARGASVTLSAVHAQTGAWVGAYRFSPDDQADHALAGWLEMGLWVHPDYWADGYASELPVLCQRLAFEKTDVPGLSARVMRDNVRGLKTLARHGLSLAGPVDIPVEDSVAAPGWLYRISRQDWTRQEQRQEAVSEA